MMLPTISGLVAVGDVAQPAKYQVCPPDVYDADGVTLMVVGLPLFE